MTYCRPRFPGNGEGETAKRPLLTKRTYPRNGNELESILPIGSRVGLAKRELGILDDWIYDDDYAL